MGVAKQQSIEIDHAHAAIDIVDQAFRAKKIGPRQHRALSKHAAKHTPEHIRAMLKFMEHKTLREAHRAVQQTGM